MMFPNKTFNWPRHIAIAFTLLTFINLLVIFAPNILGIFGVIGRLEQPWDQCALRQQATFQKISVYVPSQSSFNGLSQVRGKDTFVSCKHCNFIKQPYWSYTPYISVSTSEMLQVNVCQA